MNIHVLTVSLVAHYGSVLYKGSIYGYKHRHIAYTISKRKDARHTFSLSRLHTQYENEVLASLEFLYFRQISYY